jgi:hypothetical protein
LPDKGCLITEWFFLIWSHPETKMYEIIVPQLFNIEKLTFLPVSYLIMWFMKTQKNFEKYAILKKWQLVFFWGVQVDFGEKYAWFVIEILIHESKTCLLDMLWSQKIIKKSCRYNTDYI